MAYCTPEDIYRNVGGLSSDSEKVDPTFLMDLIARKGAYINSVISNRYNVPVAETASPMAFNLLKDICIDLCRMSIEAKVGIATTDGENEQTTETALARKAQARLKEIRESRLDLIDAIECSSCETFDTGFYNSSVDCVEGLDDYNYNDDDPYNNRRG